MAGSNHEAPANTALRNQCSKWCERLDEAPAMGLESNSVIRAFKQRIRGGTFWPLMLTANRQVL
jgi:hypothetical protein